jgi:hypothetical protein
MNFESVLGHYVTFRNVQYQIICFSFVCNFNYSQGVVAPPPETALGPAMPSPTRDPLYVYAKGFKSIPPYQKLQAWVVILCSSLWFL